MNDRQARMLASFVAAGGEIVGKGSKLDCRTLAALERQGLVTGTGVAGVDLVYRLTEKGRAAAESSEGNKMLADVQDKLDWPLQKEVTCLFCGAKRTARRDPGFDVRNGLVLYTYSAPPCECEGEKEARKQTTRFNRAIRGMGEGTG